MGCQGRRRPWTSTHCALTREDPIVLGLVVIMPIAPIPQFGIARQLPLGRFARTNLAALTTKKVYSRKQRTRMAAPYPAAGPGYTSMERGTKPDLGLMTAWAMFLGYLIEPSLAAYQTCSPSAVLPQIQHAVLVSVFIGTLASFSLQGICATARADMAFPTIIYPVPLGYSC
jgi:hypothetical protein